MAKGKGPGALALLLGKPSEGDDAGDVEDEELSTDSGDAAAEALVSAVKAGDAKAVLSAFEELYDHCATKGAGSDEETDDEY